MHNVPLTANVYQDFDPKPHEQMVALYESKLCNLYKGHPVHGQITTALTALRFQPGKPNIDYDVRNTDGQLVPISCLLELNDENRVWEKNGVGGAGGAMFLIDRDGTILSTSTDAEELEPLIKKALNIE